MRGLGNSNPVSHLFVRWLCVGGALAALGLVKHPVTEMVGLFGPMAVALIHPLEGAFVHGFHRTPSQCERFADNSYYLGFIFTQVALLVGFLPMVVSGAEVGSSDVLRAFSMALGASLIGLVARTWLVQANNSLTENQEIIENEVQALALSITDRANVVLGQFETIGGRLTGAYGKLNEELDAAVGSITGTLDRYRRELSADGEAMLGAIEETGRVATGAGEAVSTRQVAFVEDLRRAVEAIAKVRDGATAEVDASSQALRATAAALEAGAKAIAEADEIGGAIQGLTADIGRTSGELGRFEAQVGSSAGSIAQATASAVSRIDGAAEEGTALALRRAETFREDLEAAVGLLEGTLRNFRTELERIRV